MTGTTAQLGYTTEAFETFLENRDEPDWLIDQRREAWEEFSRRNWPQRDEEEWFRTDIRLFKLDRFPVPGLSSGHDVPAPASLPAGVLAQDVQLGGSVLSLDSRPLKSQLDEKWARQGVLFGSLEQLICQHGDLIRPHLFTHAVDPRVDKFSALHAACWSGGQLLYVPRNVVVDQPLHALSMLSDGGVDFGHTLVILEEGAEATMLSEMTSTSDSDAGLHCGATELLLAPGAKLRFVSLQDWGQKTWHFAHQKAVLDRDASIQWTIGALGSRLAKVNQHVALVGEGANSQVNGVMFTEGKQHLSYHTLQHHQAPHCQSNFLYKSALQDKSRTVWRGMIKVDHGAQKTDGYQRNDNLLLSADARADSIPGLEIEADDVRCTHGSTSGRVNDEMLFYARCRGFTRREAIRLVVTGFFQQVFDRVTIESVREALGQAIARRVREYE